MPDLSLLFCLLLGGLMVIGCRHKSVPKTPSTDETSAAERRHQARKGLSDAPVNVKDFGAKGNGRTDDTEAIRIALSFAQQNNRYVVFFPEGRYMVKGNNVRISKRVLTNAFEIGSHPIELRGEGPEKSVIKVNSKNPIRLFKSNAIVKHFSCSKMGFIGNEAADFQGGVAFAFERFKGVHIHDCHFYNFSGMAFLGGNSPEFISRDFVFQNNKVDGRNLITAAGIHLYNAHDIKVNNNTFIRVARPFDLEVDGNREIRNAEFVENTVRDGDRATRAKGESYTGVHIELEDQSSVHNIRILRNQFKNNCDDCTPGSKLGGGDIFIDNNGYGVIDSIFIEGNKIEGPKTQNSSAAAILIENVKYA
ncbi:MAG: glycosyl hydrolase family 28-related protein, partial [Bacteroidota bacterium]